MTWTDMENFFTRFLEIAGQIEGEKFYSYSFLECFLVSMLVVFSR